MRALFDHRGGYVHAPAPLNDPKVAESRETACGTDLRADGSVNWCFTSYPPNAMDSIWCGKTHQLHESMPICVDCARALGAGVAASIHEGRA